MTDILHTSVIPYSQMQNMAAAVAKSGLFGVKDEAQALSLMLVAQAEGLHPAIAARDYHIIQGRPTLKADTMLARFQAAGGKVEWELYTDTRVIGHFSHPQSPKPVTVDWDLKRAEKITYWDKDEGKHMPLTHKQNWRQYPRAMLRARVVSEGVRTCFPGVAVGTYTVEEAEDMPEVKDVTPVSVEAAVAQATAPTMKAEALEGWISVLTGAGDQKTLRKAFGEAHAEAHQLRDGTAVLALTDAYEARKHALEADGQK